jgi:hypothetical protein
MEGDLHHPCRDILVELGEYGASYLLYKFDLIRGEILSPASRCRFSLEFAGALVAVGYLLPAVFRYGGLELRFVDLYS